MMNHPKLLPSQELVLHQVSVDSFSPATPSVLKLPTSPLLARSPFSPAATAASSLSPSLSSTLNPSTSIVRPQIRLREEWERALADVDAFSISPQAVHSSSVERTDAVLVRYIADCHDRAWLSRRPVLALRGEDGGVSVLRGKTGGMSSRVPVQSHLSTSALEDVFTALELAAYNQPEVPLERLLPYAKQQLAEGALSDEALDELHAYWLLRRNGTGGLLSTIPNLRATVREDNEIAQCHPAVLRDCPLPFKQRDWYVPVIERRRPASCAHRSNTSKNSRSPLPEEGPANTFPLEQLKMCADYVEKASRLSWAMLQREETRLDHTHLTLYELACLRNAAEVDRAALVLDRALIEEQALSRYLATAFGSAQAIEDAIE